MKLIPSVRFEHTGKRTWSLLDEQGRSQGTLLRPKWYSSTAGIIVGNKEFRVKPMKGWTSDIALYVGDIPALIADYQWRATVITTVRKEVLYRIVRKSWFSNSYRFLDASGVLRLEVRMGFNWRTFERTYVFTEAGSEPMDPLHLLFVMQAIITQQDRAAAAG